MNGKRYHLTVTDSTNLHTMRLLGQSGMNDGDIVIADYQTSGKGQRGRGWEGEAGMNLTFSLVVKPDLHASQYFLLSAAIALAIIDTLAEFGLSAKVKWPNDILVNDRKIAGILIETMIKGNDIETAVVGVGLNVNQSIFEGDYNWTPTSIKLATGSKSEARLERVLELILKYFEHYRKLAESPEELMSLMNEQLYSRGKAINLRRGDEVISGVVREVNLLGELLVNVDGAVRSFQNGEISLSRT